MHGYPSLGARSPRVGLTSRDVLTERLPSIPGTNPRLSGAARCTPCSSGYGDRHSPVAALRRPALGKQAMEEGDEAQRKAFMARAGVARAGV